MARVQGLPADSVGDWTLAPKPRSVARARELARDQLLVWDLDALVDTTELLVSELVTNALRYGEGDIRLRLLLRPHPGVRGLGRRPGPAAPPPRPRHRRGRPRAATGRPAQRRLGLAAAPTRGKTVWFELALPWTAGAAQARTRRRRCSACSEQRRPQGRPPGEGTAPGQVLRRILSPSHTSGSYLRSTARSFSGISALSVILMPSGQTSVQHLVMLQ